MSWAGERQDHWAGARAGSGQCQCGERGDCLERGASCNCDSHSPHWTSDHGTITDRNLLPVTSLHFGDTGTPLDRKEGRFTLGPLSCSHPTPHTRRGGLSLARTEEREECPEIFLEMRPSADLTGEIYHLVSGLSLCRLTLLSERLLLYEWGPLHDLTNLTLSMEEDSLVDGRWHSVNIEHNSVEVAVVVDREIVATHHHETIRQSRPDTGSYYLLVSGTSLNGIYKHNFQDVESDATSRLKLEIRMIEVNGKELMEYEEGGKAEEELSLAKKDSSDVPVEAVHAMTNDTIKKLFPLPNLIILITVLSLMILFILLVTLGVVRYVDRAKSEAYYTQEEILTVET